MNKGLFITFEGGEGSGKSTQIKLLAEHLRGKGREVLLTREPGGSPGAEEIRNLLVTGRPDRWSPLAETLLFYAARVEHWREVIQPALQAGKIVLCDRFFDSTTAYQVYAGGLSEDTVSAVHNACLKGAVPDLTFIIDLPVQTGLARAQSRAGNETRFEAKGIAFHERLRAGFLEIARQNASRCVVVDGEAAIQDVQSKLVEILATRFAGF